MSSRSSRRSSCMPEFLCRLQEEYINLTAEEDNSDESDVWEECVRILHLALQAYFSHPETLMLAKKCVVQIVRVLPGNVLSKLQPKPVNLAGFLLEAIQNHGEDELAALFKWFVTWKTFPKLYFATVSEDDQQLIYNQLFAVVFKLMRRCDVEMPKMLALLCDMIRACECITFLALDVILYHLVREQLDRRQAFAALVIQECQEELSSPIDEMICDQLLSEEVPEERTKFARFGFEVINRLYPIHPCLSLCRAMTDVLVEESRYTQSAVECLMQLFTEGGSVIAIKLPKLWNTFIKCVKKSEYRTRFLHYCPRFFLQFGRYNYMCRPLVDILVQFSRDQMANVRLLTITAITNTVLLMPYLLCRNKELLQICRILTSDRKENVRKEAFYSLGKIYTVFEKVKDLQDQAQIIVKFIMHEYGSTLYYNPKRQVINAVIRKYIVPDVLSSETRMNKLVIMWTILDDDSKSCFHNYLDISKKVRLLKMNFKRLESAPDTAAVRDQRSILLRQINFLTSGQTYKQEIREEKCDELQIMKEGPVKSSFSAFQYFVMKHSHINGPCFIREEYDTVVFTVFKSAQVLLAYINQLEESSTQDVQIREDVMTLIYELVCEYPDRVGNSDMWNELVSLSRKNTDLQNITLLKLFASLPMEIDKHFMTEESDSFWMCSLRGPPQQLKFSLKCICKHEEKFSEDIERILRDIHNTSEQDEEAYLKAIMSLGYLAQYLQTNMYLEIITRLCDKVIQSEILHSTQRESSSNLMIWSERCELPHYLRCKVEALKAITRVVCRRRSKALTSRLMDLLGYLVDRGGDYTQQGHLGTIDKSWLRLAAGLSYLKMCEDIVLFKSQIRVDYFFKMARLMNDPIRQVRTKFILKLGKKLMQFNKLNFGLVNHFLAYFCLCELEIFATAREEWRQLLQNCIKEKRLNVWYYTTIYSNPTREQVIENYHLVLPEFSVQIAVTLLAHYVTTAAANVAKRKITDCLTFLMTSLMDPKVSHSFPLLSPDYYKNIFNQIKVTKDAVDPDDDEINQKLHNVCRIGCKILNKMHRKPRGTVMPDHIELDGRFYIINF